MYLFIYLSFRAEGEIREQTVSVHSQFEQQIEELFVCMEDRVQPQ